MLVSLRLPLIKLVFWHAYRYTGSTPTNAPNNLIPLNLDPKIRSLQAFRCNTHEPGFGRGSRENFQRWISSQSSDAQIASENCSKRRVAGTRNRHRKCLLQNCWVSGVCNWCCCCGRRSCSTWSSWLWFGFMLVVFLVFFKLILRILVFLIEFFFFVL
ncbi:hypothetical protein KCV07_g138, partial [Aureobasidium melanogenum]